MTEKRRTSGYGRSFADVPVIVNKPFDQYFKDDDWTVLSEDEDTTTFEYSCPNSYAGDDETVVDAFFRDCPTSFDHKGEGSDAVKIDWANGVY